MNEHLPDDLGIIHQRNRLLLRATTVVIIADFIANLLWRSPLHFLLVILLGGLFFIASTSYLIHKKLFVRGVMYYMVTVIWIMVSILNWMDSDLTSLSFYFLIPIGASSIFPSLSLTIYSTILSGFAYNSFAFYYGKSVMGEDFVHSDIVYYIALFLSISFLGIVQQRFSEKLRKQAVESALAANTLKEEALHHVEKMKENSKALSVFSGKLEENVNDTTTKTADVTEGFGQMNDALQEQNESITGLLTNVQDVSEQIRNINQSSEKMKETSENSRITIEETLSSFHLLNKDFSQLKETFQESLDTNFELSQRTQEIGKIIEALKAISSQTN